MKVKVKRKSDIAVASLATRHIRTTPQKAMPGFHYNENLIQEQVYELITKNRIVCIVGPSGSGKLQQSYMAARQLGIQQIDLINAKQLACSLQAPIIGDIRNHQQLNPFEFKKPCMDSGHMIILQEIGYLSFLEQVSLFAYTRAALEHRHIVLTSSLPISNIGDDNHCFQPFQNLLNESNVTLPWLKSIPYLIPNLAHIILKKEALRLGKPHIIGISNHVLSEFLKYDWPGNIRELEGVIKVAVALSRNTILSETDFALFLRHLNHHTTQP